MIRLISARRLRRLEGRLQALEEVREQFQASNAKLVTERALLKQLASQAEAREHYWRTRAERFMDQIGASSGIITGPTMTDPAPTPQDDVRGVFAALGRSEINQGPSHEPPAAAPPSPVLPIDGVDPAIAAAAVADLLARASG